MDLKKTVTNYLMNTDEINELALKEGDPALLFVNSTKDNKFGEIYLFNKFGFCTGSSLVLNSEITDHYTEKNYSIQDHWALSPKMYTLSGYVGEVIYTPPKGWANWVEANITDYLKPLTVISPVLSSYTQSAINLTAQLQSSLQRYGKIARQIFQTITKTNTSNQSNQQYVARLLEKIREERILVNIYTPYGEYENMAIMSINIRQDAFTKYRSTLEIQMKQWRDTETITRKATKDELSDLSGMQKQTEQNNGVATEQKTEFSSTAYKLLMFGQGQ